MHHAFRTFLNLPFRQQQARAHHFLAVQLEQPFPDHDIADTGFVRQGDEDRGALAGALAHQHHAGAANGCAILQIADAFAGDDAFFIEALPQELCGIAFQRQPDGLVIGEDMFRQGHRGQGRDLFRALIGRR